MINRSRFVGQRSNGRAFTHACASRARARGTTSHLAVHITWSGLGSAAKLAFPYWQRSAKVRRTPQQAGGHRVHGPAPTPKE